jgi:hypothetical protein
MEVVKMAKVKFDKYELYMGLNDKDTKVQKVDTIEAYKIVSKEVAKRFNGGTIFQSSGVYKHDDGTVVIENTLKIEIILFDKSIGENDVRMFVAWLKEMFNQESVAVQQSKVYSDLW